MRTAGGVMGQFPRRTRWGSRPQGRNTRVEHCLSAVHNRSDAAQQPSTLPDRDGDGDRGLMRTKRQLLQFRRLYRHRKSISELDGAGHQLADFLDSGRVLRDHLLKKADLAILPRTSG
jgi:hypothetical protein